MQRLLLIPLLFLGLLCAGCHEKTPNRSSRRQTDESRQLAAQDYEGARTTIRTMRRAYPLALTARENGILLMDSIDLAATRTAIRQLEGTPHHSVSLPKASALPELYRRLRFYERKLQHDHRQRKSHD